MANTRSAIKRVRQNRRRATMNAPLRTAAKTRVAKALRVATAGTPGDVGAALAEAMSALDRAAKTGAIHANAAARRKSRLALKVNAALGGVALEPTSARARTTGKAAAAKSARARVAAAKKRTETGPRTAAGKARVALAKTTAATTSSTSAKPGRKPSTGKTTTTSRATSKAKTPAKTPAKS